MDTYRKTAIIVGVLFIIGTVAGILSVVFTGSILDDPDYLVKISANENQIIIGAFLILIMGFALVMVPVMLFPLLKKQAEEVARLGCQVTGVDLSPRSIEVAQRHAEQMGLTITYRVAPGEQLPFHDNTFDLVYCCDVLEHVSDVSVVIAGSAHVLKPGGMYLYDTINRTWLSKLMMITLAQDWLRIVPPNLHDWKQFIRPNELHNILTRHGLEPCDTIGLMPDMNPIKSIKRLFDLRKLKRNEMSYAEFGRGMMFQMSRLTFVNYMGYALKPLRNT